MKGQNMNIQDAEKLARELMAKHLDDSWELAFNSKLTAFGQCNYTAKKILLSKPLTEVNNEQILREVILHEIAHALTHSWDGHNSVWKEKCIEIGGTGKTYANQEAYIIFTYVGTCPNGHKIYRKGPLSKRKIASCVRCSPEFSLHNIVIWKKTRVVMQAKDYSSELLENY